MSPIAIKLRCLYTQRFSFEKHNNHFNFTGSFPIVLWNDRKLWNNGLSLRGQLSLVHPLIKHMWNKVWNGCGTKAEVPWTLARVSSLNALFCVRVMRSVEPLTLIIPVYRLLSEARTKVRQPRLSICPVLCLLNMPGTLSNGLEAFI